MNQFILSRIDSVLQNQGSIESPSLVSQSLFDLQSVDPYAPLAIEGPVPTSGIPSVESNLKQSSTQPLDDLFNFQLVVFEVDGTLFQVIKNGFNVPGTIFETMFALPGPASPESGIDDCSMEGTSVENPIRLTDISAKDFRAFLKVSYPFIGPSISLTYEDWVGILKLSTMWDFQQIREVAISKLSSLINEKTPADRISLGRTYQVSSWLRDEYVKLAQKTELKLDELRDSSGMSLDWETIAKILSVREQIHLRILKSGRTNGRYTCGGCSTAFGWKMEVIDCRCNVSSVVDSAFQEEFLAMKESVKQESVSFVQN